MGHVDILQAEILKRMRPWSSNAPKNKSLFKRFAATMVIESVRFAKP
jgi:hypothetical protein